jgi:MarR family transcriptional regulator, organic hydroperoxide resistance regulator
MQSLGLHFTQLAKYYLGTLSARLSDLEIDRYFYPLILISDSEGSICQKDLALQLKIDNVTMVRIVDYLAKAGYIKRVKSRSDRRMHNLLITPKAEKALPEIKKAYKELNKICFKGFKTDEKQQFELMLMKMEDNLQNNPRREFKINFKNISR